MQFLPFEAMANLNKEPFTRLGVLSYAVDFSAIAIVAV
jgi:hypothetical protein